MSRLSAQSPCKFAGGHDVEVFAPEVGIDFTKGSAPALVDQLVRITAPVGTYHYFWYIHPACGGRIRSLMRMTTRRRRRRSMRTPGAVPQQPGAGARGLVARKPRVIHGRRSRFKASRVGALQRNCPKGDMALVLGLVRAGKARYCPHVGAKEAARPRAVS